MRYLLNWFYLQIHHFFLTKFPILLICLMDSFLLFSFLFIFLVNFLFILCSVALMNAPFLGFITTEPFYSFYSFYFLFQLIFLIIFNYLSFKFFVANLDFLENVCSFLLKVSPFINFLMNFLLFSFCFCRFFLAMLIDIIILFIIYYCFFLILFLFWTKATFTLLHFTYCLIFIIYFRFFFIYLISLELRLIYQLFFH